MDSQKKADSLRFLFLHTKRTRPFQTGPFVARHINNWSSGPILIIRNMRRFRPQFPVPSCFGNPRLPSNGPRKDCS